MPARMSTLDEATTNALRVLKARHRVTDAHLATATGLSVATIGRRMNEGGWLLSEIELLAGFFATTPEALITDSVNLRESRVVEPYPMGPNALRRAAVRSNRASSNTRRYPLVLGGVLRAVVPLRRAVTVPA